MLSSVFIALIGFTGAAQAASALDSCVKTNMTGIKDVDEQLKSFGVKDVNDPCPEQDAYDRGVYNCSKKVEKLRKEQEKLKEIVKDKCEVAQELQALAKKNTGKQTDSEDGSKSLNEKAKHIAQQEYEKLEAIKNRVKTMREYFASLAEGAKNVQQEVTDKASSAPKDRDDQTERLNEAGRRRGARASNHEEGKNFFNGDSISKVESLISKAREGGLTKGDVDQIKTPLTKEPLRIAAAADDWTKQIEARQKVVKSQAAVYDDNYFTTSDRSKKLGDTENKTEDGKGSGTGSGGGDSAGNAASSMGDASKAMQAASGLTGAGGGGGSSGAAETGAGSSPDYSSYANSLGSGASPSGSSGAANSYESGSTNTNYGGGSSANGITPTSAGGLKAALTDGGRSVIGKNDGTNGIKNLDTSTAVNTNTGSDRTGSSATKGSSLREALRERLNQSVGDSSGGGTAVASVTGSGASSGGGTGASASSGAAPNLLPLSTPIASDNALEASTASVGGDLGNTDFSLAGSETDAAVKGMLKDFGVSEESTGRAPAALNQQAPEILTSDSPSLFSRTRDVHQRSLKKGLVINGLRAKL